MKKLFNIGTKMILAAGLMLPVLAATANDASAASFKDVPTKHWAYKNIEVASKKGYVMGFKDGTFRPDGNVNRAEFAAFLARTFDGEERVKEQFTDVSDTFWAKDNIEEGIALGFINPTDYKNNKFEPTKVMTRQEIAKWLANVLKASNAEYGEMANAIQNGKYTLLPVTEFNKGGISKSEYGNFGLMLGTGLIQGDDKGNFKPTGNTSRAEVASILIRFDEAKKKAPTSFKGLNEIVEVAKTGTNMLSASNFVYLGERDFTTIAGKSLKWTNGLGTGTVERMIFIEGRDYKKALNNSIYAKMFVGDKWGVGNFEDYITVYVENSFTSNSTKTNIDEYSSGHSTGLFSNTGVSVLELSKRFGYSTFNPDKWGDFFKKGQKVNYWSMTGFDYVKNDWFVMGISDSNSFPVKYE